MPSKEDTGSPINLSEPFENIIYVRYLCHVFYNRSSTLLMGPQTREAVGWLFYDCDLYIILSWGKDAGPPTLKGGDPKASGSSAGLVIRPKTKDNRIEQLKEIIRAWGDNPEEILSKDALLRGNITESQDQNQNRQLSILAEQLKQLIKEKVSA